MFRYVLPVDDYPHTFGLTSDPVAVAATPDINVEFWAENNTEVPAHDRTFQVFGTGHPLPFGAKWAGTCQRSDGFVWHLYEVTP